MARRIVNKLRTGRGPTLWGDGLWFRVRNARALARALHGVTRHKKMVNGANHTAVNIILDKPHPGHRINGAILHFGPPEAILLASETTTDFPFVGIPAGVSF